MLTVLQFLHIIVIVLTELNLTNVILERYYKEYNLLIIIIVICLIDI